MNKFDYLVNEAQNLNTDARKAVMARMLKAEQDRLENEMIPLNADHSDAVRQMRQEKCLQAIGCAAVAAGVVALTVCIVKKVNKGIEKKAAAEKAKLEKERKEMIQKLARIKGRA